MSKNILITGIAGFIGSHIAEELIKRSYVVYGVDNLSSGRIKNLNSIIQKINFIESDLLNDKLLDSLSKNNIDIIVHTAAIPSVYRSIENPLLSHDNNINLTFKLLEWARNNNIKKFIYSGSSSAYGQQTQEWKEESLPSFPISPYALQKYVGEMYCKYYYQYFQLKTISLRYFNVFGPRQNPNSLYSAVIPIFIKSALKIKKLLINGDGSNTRDFTYIKNVINANIQAIESMNNNTYGNVFNVALGKSVSIVELARIIIELTKSSSEIEFLSERPGDIKHSKASINKIQNYLNYKPEVELKDGLLATIEYIKNNEL